MELYNQLLELSVRLRIDGELELGQLVNETARCILLEREKTGAATLRRACSEKDES